MAAPLSLIYLSTGWWVGKGRQWKEKKPGVDGTPGRRFIRGQIVVTGQPGLGKRNPGKTGDGSGTGP